MNVIRVLHSVRSWLPLTQNWIKQQILDLPSNIEVSVLAGERERNVEDSHFPLYVAEEESPLRFRFESWLSHIRPGSELYSRTKAMKRVRPDVVHSHFGNRGWFDRKSVAATGAAHVVTFYGYDVNYLPRQSPVWLSRYRELFDSGAVILCEGPHMREVLIGMGADPSAVKVHHLGVPVQSIAFRPNLWEGGELNVLIASAFREKKGIPLALEALGRVHRDTRLSVDLVGEANEEERSQREKAEILDVIARYDLPVRMRGFVSLEELRNLMRRSHLFLAASRTASDGDTEGGAPVVLLEAAAIGIPIVSTNHCDIPEVVIDGQTGLLASEGDVESFHRTFRSMIERRGEWPQFVRRGRARVEKEFDSVTQAGRLAALYEELCRRSGDKNSGKEAGK